MAAAAITPAAFAQALIPANLPLLIFIAMLFASLRTKLLPRSR